MKCRLSVKDILKGYEIMKNVMKKVIAVFAVLCVAMTSVVSCSDGKGNSGSSSTSNGGSGDGSSLSDEDKQELMQMPLNIGEAGDGNALAGDGELDLDGDDPVAVTTAKADAKTTTANNAVVTAVQEVTDANNKPVTQAVQVTDADGAVQTDANSQPVTQMAVVTEVVTVPADENSGTPDTTDAPDDTTQAANSDYKPKNDGRYAMWIDVSKDDNFYFEGDMLKATFKVKEGIPDGDYKIRIAPDLADVAGVSVKPSKVMDGTIRVNNGEIEAADVSNETGALVFYGDNIACKQGDTIDFNINIKNNTGLVGFCIWFYFDGNALEFVDACATGEYEEIARQTEIGRGNKIEE